MIIAGEASGDLHAAKLVHAVNAMESKIQFFGIGGARMREAGVDVRVDSAQLAVVGLVEVLAHRKVIFGALNQMRELLRKAPPDLLILTDYPEFNLRLAKTAKQLGIKVLYYISPQVWAWRQWRVKNIRNVVDMMAVVFPFEEAFYRQHHVPVRFVGHPLVGEVNPSADRETLRNEFDLDSTKQTVGLFPGSRQSEIKRLLPIILKTAQQLKQKKPSIQFLLPLASTLNRGDIGNYLQNTDLPVKLIEDRTYDVIQACDAIITVSGTVTLEIALLGTPMVIINKVAPLTYFIVRKLLKIDHIGLCNIVANKRIVPEFIQNNATPDNIGKEIQRMLDDTDYNKLIRQQLKMVGEKLGAAGGAENIARLTLEMLSE